MSPLFKHPLFAMSASLFSKFEGAGPDVPSFSGPLLIEVEDNGAAAAE